MTNGGRIGRREFLRHICAGAAVASFGGCSFGAKKKGKSKKPVLKINPEGRMTHIHRSPGGDGTELGNGLKRYKKNYFDSDQLYDLKRDPGETKNLANDPEHKQLLEKMKAELKKHLLGVPGTFAEFK